MPNIIDLSAGGEPAFGGKNNNRKGAGAGSGERPFAPTIKRRRRFIVFGANWLQSVKSLPRRQAGARIRVIGAGIFVALIVLILSFVIFKKDVQLTQAAWFNDDWHYRQQFDVFNASTTEDLIDFQVELSTSTLGLYNIYNTEGTATKSRSDFFDLRFTDMGGNLLDYWFPDATSTMQSVYVKFPVMPMNATSTLFMYYGNQSAPDKRNGPAVFPDFFEDFKNGLNTAKWPATSATPSVVNNALVLADAAALEGVRSNSVYLKDIVLEFSASQDNTDLQQGYLGFSNTAALGTSFVNDDSAYVNLDATAGGAWEVGATNEAVASAGTSATEDTTYHDFTISWGPDVIFEVDGASSATINTNEPDEASYIRLENSSNTRNLTIDWVLIRKYVQTDPDVMSTSGTAEETGGGPVGYWKFDEGYGTTAYDSSSYKNNGTLTSMSTTGTSTAWQIGKVGKALMFDGSDDYVNLGDPVNGSLDMKTSDFTISAWIKTDSNTAIQAIVSKETTAGVASASPEYKFELADSGKLRAVICDGLGGSVVSVTANNVLRIGEWYHAVVVFNRDANATFFLNAKADGSGSITAHQGNVDNTTPLTIGKRAYVSTPRYFNGLIDEVKIYNYALTASQILTEYNSGKSVMLGAGLPPEEASGLVGWWKMNETWEEFASTTNNNRINDYSGQGNNLISKGWTAGVDGPDATSTAKYGNAAELKGTDDYLCSSSDGTNCADNGNLDVDIGDFTLETWFYLNSLPSAITSLISKGGNNAVGYGLSINASNQLAANIYATNGTDQTLNGITTLSANTWYHASAVFDRDQKIYLYLNGNLETSASYSAGNSGSLDNAFNFTLGSYKDGAQYFLTGLLDDVKIYKTARTPDQIMQDYLTGPSPVAYYDFEEGSGLTAYDKSGQGYNGTITAGTGGYKKGKIGRAYDFDRANTKVSSGNVLNMGTSDMSICAWFNSDDVSITQTIVAKEGAAGESSADPGWAFKLSASQIRLYLSDGAAAGYVTLQGNTTLVSGIWYFGCLTFDRDGNGTIYLNGVNNGSTSIATENGNVTNTAGFYIGNRELQSPLRVFDGKIDEVKIYNYALTPWQIAQEYNQGKPTAHWSFDEGQGTTANNAFAATPGTLAGTLTNMSTTGTSTVWTTGKFGKALLFDGTNDTVAVTDTTGSSLDIVSAGSMSAWIKPTSVSGSKYIIDKNETNGYALMLNGSALKGYFGNSSCSGGVVKANQWQYVSAAWDGAKIRCYLDGKEVADTAYSTALTAQNTSLYIGSDGGAANYFSGLIDEPKIYQYALSPVQIKKDYDDGLAVALGTSDGGQNSQQGLVAWYRMNETPDEFASTTNNNRVNDYSGNGNNLISKGWTAGTDGPDATSTAKYGNAAELKGTDDYLCSSSDGSNCADNGNLDVDIGDFTLETWFSLDSLPSAITSLISKGANGSTGYGLSINASNQLAANIYAVSGTDQTLSGITTLSANTWYHASAVFDRDQKVYLYLNGNLESSASYSSGNTGSLDNAFNFTLGSYKDGAQYFLTGQIDDVKLYKTARTADQIMQDYLTGPSPIAYYDFEEGSGLTANDKSGQGYNGTITAGAGGYKKGKIGRSYEFDGANTKIDTGSDWIGTAGYTTQALSVSAWIYLDTFGESNFGRIITNGKYWFYPYSNTLYFSSNGSTEISALANSILLNKWYHVAVTRTTNGTANFYINGVLSGTANQSSGTPVAGTSNVIIGNNTGQTATFDGRIDDLKVYNYVLTPWQIAQEYNGGAPVGYWKMDEGQGQTIYDWSGNNYNGTLSLSGSPATSTAWQVQTGCKVGRCLSFDGTDDYATLGSSVNVTGEATVSAWIKPSTVSAGALVIAGDSNSGNTTQQLSLQLNNTAGKVSGKWGNSTIITSDKSLVADTWYYVTLTRSGTTGAWIANLYINGALDNTATTATNPSSVSSWSIARNGAVSGSYFKGKIDDLKIYNYAQSPAQIKNDYNAGFGTYFQDTWVCGDYFTDQRDGHSYDTVAIGNQCWMQDNLNYGTIINSPAAASVATACTGHIGETLTIDGTSCYCETDTYASCQLGTVSGTTLKYCYSNTESYCTSDGALYEWQEAMDLAGSCAHSSCTPATGNKGICPAGWHIPTDAEYKTLEMNQGMSQAQADATSWRGNQEGDKLKAGGLCQGRTPCATSRFDAPLAGDRDVTGAFNNRGSSAYFWSSSQRSAASAWYRALVVSYSTVYRFTDTKYDGFTVRCLKD